MPSEHQRPQSHGQAGPLNGIRVLDLTTVIMGPLATQILGDLGADVIKIETDSGDASRSMGPGPVESLSGVSLNLLRNKRSIVVDLQSVDGLGIARRLTNWADVVVTNIRPASLDRLGLSYDAVVDENPNLVYCQAAGFASDGPEADRPAYDEIIQAATGMVDLVRRSTGTTRYAPTLLADKVAGMSIANAVLAALVHRSSTGQGQHIEVPMFDSVLAFLLVEHLNAATSEPPLGPTGYSRVLASTRMPFESSDGVIALLPYSDENWQRLLSVGGHGELIDDARFATNAARHANAEQVYETLREIVRTKSTDEWVEWGDVEGIAVSVVPTLDAIVADPALHRGVLEPVDHPVAGRYQHIRFPATFSATPLQAPGPAPLIGQHTRSILTDIGYSDADVEHFHDANVVRSDASDPPLAR